MIEVGTRVKFVPAILATKFDEFYADQTKVATGKVFLVNKEHRVFWIEFKSFGVRQVESFKFFDIGKSVKILG